MAKRQQPSFELKMIVWDAAVKLGKNNYTAIQREIEKPLELKRRDLEIFENTPDCRTIKKIITVDINKLPVEVVLTQIPQYLWSLRDDYEILKQSLEEETAFENDREETRTYYESVPLSVEVKLYLRKQLERHFNELAQTAQTLADNIQTYKAFCSNLESNTPLGASDAGIEGNLIDGGKVGIVIVEGEVELWYGWGDDPNGTVNVEPVNNLLATCLFEHFKYRFPDLVSFQTWHELTTRPIEQEIIDQLRLISLSRNFGFCPLCSVCKDLQV